jgi:hypothetical protein
MSNAPSFRCFDYVNRPFAIVERALGDDPIPLLASGSAGAKSAGPRTATLHVALGPVDVGAEITLELRGVTRGVDALRGARVTYEIAWRAASASGAFPEMLAELAVYALSSSETQLDLTCRYTPPLGVVGQALDAVAMHRLAESSVQNFLREVASHLRQVLPTAPQPG